MSEPYYQDDFVTLYHGDAREILPQLGHFDNGLVLTDPPYGVGVRYGKGFDDSRNDYWGWLADAIREWRAAAPLVVFTHKVAALKHLVDWDWAGVWNKPLSGGTGVGNSPVVPHWEPIFMYGIYSLGTRERMFTPDVFTFKPQPTSHAGLRGRESWAKVEVDDHPVPKPEDLWRTLLKAFGQAGGVILDPFAGSGTTLRVCKDAGRRCIGIEIEERFCESIVRRLGQECLDFGEAA